VSEDWLFERRSIGIQSVFDSGELRGEFEKNGIDPKFIQITWKDLVSADSKQQKEDEDWEKCELD